MEKFKDTLLTTLWLICTGILSLLIYLFVTILIPTTVLILIAIKFLALPAAIVICIYLLTK